MQVSWDSREFAWVFSAGEISAVLLHTDLQFICETKEGKKQSHIHCLSTAENLIVMQDFWSSIYLDCQKQDWKVTWIKYVRILIGLFSLVE